MMMRTRTKRAAVALAFVGVFLAASAQSCGSSSNDKQESYSDKQGRQALAKWGNPAVTNFNEYQMAKEVTELRDRANLVMNAYLQGNDGSLRCFGKVVGYGLPYSAQITPPDRPRANGAQEAVREPNGLFMPGSAEATWVRVVDPATGKTVVSYVEPRLLITPLQFPCKAMDQ